MELLTDEGRELYDTVQTRIKALHQLEQIEHDSRLAVGRAEDEFVDALNQSAEKGQAGNEVSLKGALNLAIAQADPAIHRPRIEQAENLVIQAQSAFQRHITSHFELYLEKQRPECEKLTAEIRKVNQRYNDQIAPLLQRRQSVRDGILATIGYVHPFTSEDVSTEPEEVPFPTETLEEYRNPPEEDETDALPAPQFEIDDRPAKTLSIL
jgi:hypothetical protein